jgi:hypothetical protein
MRTVSESMCLSGKSAHFLLKLWIDHAVKMTHLMLYLLFWRVKIDDEYDNDQRCYDLLRRLFISAVPWVCGGGMHGTFNFEPG